MPASGATSSYDHATFGPSDVDAESPAQPLAAPRTRENCRPGPKRARRDCRQGRAERRTRQPSGSGRVAQVEVVVDPGQQRLLVAVLERPVDVDQQALAPARALRAVRGLAPRRASRPRGRAVWGCPHTRARRAPRARCPARRRRPAPRGPGARRRDPRATRWERGRTPDPTARAPATDGSSRGDRRHDRGAASGSARPREARPGRRLQARRPAAAAGQSRRCRRRPDTAARGSYRPRAVRRTSRRGSPDVGRRCRRRGRHRGRRPAVRCCRPTASARPARASRRGAGQRPDREERWWQVVAGRREEARGRDRCAAHPRRTARRHGRAHRGPAPAPASEQARQREVEDARRERRGTKAREAVPVAQAQHRHDGEVGARGLAADGRSGRCRTRPRPCSRARAPPPRSRRAPPGTDARARAGTRR